jgi:hypothetical protein
MLTNLEKQAIEQEILNTTRRGANRVKSRGTATKYHIAVPQSLKTAKKQTGRGCNPSAVISTSTPTLN